MSNWKLLYNDIPKGLKSYDQESLLTLGNGYIGWRGAPLLSRYDEDHYPGLYAAGLFNQTITPIAGRQVVNEDMVNLPNPQLVKIFVDGEPIAFDPVERSAELNFKNGRLIEKYRFNSKKGSLSLETIKAVDPIHFHSFGYRLKLKSSFDAKIDIEAIIDGTVQNKNVKRYRDFQSREFTIIGRQENILMAKTITSKIEIRVGAIDKSGQSKFSESFSENKLFSKTAFDLKAGQEYSFDRVISVATSYECPDPEKIVEDDLSALSFQKILDNSENYWGQVWQNNDIELDTQIPDLQKMIRMNIFHLNQAAQPQANKNLDASVGSRALTGEGYRGHIFWDEIFLIPYYSANRPETAKAILKYRIKRLKAAKENAAQEKERGAMYPWQSAMYGDEQAQLIHLNPVDNSWDPDNSRLQRHVSLAIFYDLWFYTHVTKDFSLLYQGGLEMLIEISRFWLNKAEYDPKDQRYHIAGVMGPDEFHEGYPKADRGGLKDNAYTNLMAAWIFKKIIELKNSYGKIFDQIAKKIDFTAEDLDKIEKISKNIALDINDDSVIAQFDKYFDLKELDFQQYIKKYGDIHRIDRLLKAENKSPDQYQVAKQADTLMLIYNLGVTETQKLIEQLGYHLAKDWLKKNYDYYLKRTVHGSTTSRPVFAEIALKIGNKKTAIDNLVTAIKSDYDDIQGGTTAEGIHIGVMGETIKLLQNEFAGIDLRDNVLKIDPKIPTIFRSMAFGLKYQGAALKFIFTPESTDIVSDKNIKIKFKDTYLDLKADKLWHSSLIKQKI